MNAIVTVIGRDKVGIIAAVCNHLAARQINVLDISQTILHGSFTMVMMVDLQLCEADFDVLSKELGELGEAMELNIRIQREEIFNAMYKI